MSLQGRLDGRKITAGFASPTNYTPTAVGNENVKKVSAHLKGIDNALASVGGGAFSIGVTQFQPDDTSPPVNVTVGLALKAIAFPGSDDSITYAQFTTDDNIDDTKDIKFEVVYSMSSSESTKKVSLNADAWVFSDADAFNKAADQTGMEDEISVPSDGQVDKLALTNIKINASELSGVGQVVAVKLFRDVDGITTNHTGDFQMISLRAYQV